MFVCERLSCLLYKNGLLLVLSITEERDKAHYSCAIAVTTGAACRTVSLVSRIVCGREQKRLMGMKLHAAKVRSRSLRRKQICRYSAILRSIPEIQSATRCFYRVGYAHTTIIRAVRTVMKLAVRPIREVWTSLAEPRLLGRGEGLVKCVYATCSTVMLGYVITNRKSVTFRNTPFRHFRAETKFSGHARRVYSNNGRQGYNPRAHRGRLPRAHHTRGEAHMR